MIFITDDGGLLDSDSTTALIGECSQPPTADANGPYNGRIGVVLSFDGSGSGDPDGSPLQYDWYFSDDTVALNAGEMPTHVYDVLGTYFVTLTVTDNDGATNSDATLATISSRVECVEGCRADEFECLDAALADRETCIEACDTRICRRACRSAYRVARSECRAAFRACRALCR
jgi:hypothetical protein